MKISTDYLDLKGYIPILQYRIRGVLNNNLGNANQLKYWKYRQPYANENLLCTEH